MTKHLLLLLLTLLLGCSNSNQPSTPTPTQTFTSPDHHLTATISTTPTLTYSLTLDKQPILSPSPLGLQFADDSLTLGPDSELLAASLTSHDSTWTTQLYKKESVRDHYNELLLTLRPRTVPYAIYQLTLRLYDDGLAFRYTLPRTLALNDTPLTLTKELTTFVFPKDAHCHAGSQLSGYSGAQEWEFLPTHLAALPTSRPTGLPLLIHTDPAPEQQGDPVWMAITESDLLDYPGLWLSPSPDAPPPPPANTKMGGASTPISTPPAEPLASTPVTLYAHPAPLLQKPLIPSPGIQIPGPPVQPLAHLSLPHTTAWRVVMVAHDPGKLIESDLVMNLATPSELPDPSWIRPGLLAWDHWWHGGTKVDNATIKSYIQLAADMHWPYQLIDWHWYGNPDQPTADITHVAKEIELPALLQFAKDRNVRCFLWLHSNDAARHDAYKTAFPLYEKWGIAGVKIDFMDRDDQDMVNWYEDVAKEAAAHHLLLNFHGAFKPTGLNRTYPNQLTREGILGNEYNRWSSRVTPEHKLTLPFTRLLAGPADFTPGGFNNRAPSQFKIDNKNTEVQGTRAAELALFVLYDSPLTCACDSPDNYHNQPGTDFLKLVPTTWKQTHVLQASVAEYLVEARQSHNNDFFLAALTSSQPRTLTIPLTFLPPGAHTLTLWQDAPDSNTNPTHLATSTRTVTNKDTLTLPLSPAGGAVAHFHPH